MSAGRFISQALRNSRRAANKAKIKVKDEVGIITAKKTPGQLQTTPATRGQLTSKKDIRTSGAVGGVGGATIAALIDKATTKAEKTDNPVTKASARKAFRDLGAAYRQSVKDAQSGKTSRKAVKALSKAKLSAFEKAFADAAKSGKKTFKFEVDGVMKPFTVTYKKKKE
tara:strand:+ start:1488 stop:1994 length:507 start_codon:yes stop_codon:yes gene_type:complete